jgi:Xaa-Pro aminopeptidase
MYDAMGECPMTDVGIDVAACRGRQQRLVEHMLQLDLDLIIVTQAEHVQYLAGPRFDWTFQPVAALSCEGQLTLVAPQRPPDVAAADEVLTYEAQWHSTLRNDQRKASTDVLISALAGQPRPRRLGVEFSTFGIELSSQFEATMVDIEPTLYALRRRKDPDELALIRKAIAGTGRMYQRAREIIAPGVTELQVFSELQSAAVDEFGEMLTGTGNDYQCGSRGGAPRNGRPAVGGELYILDLGPAYRGYFADNARTIAVTEPTDVQQRAWEFIMKAFQHVQSEVRPGKSARALFSEVQAILDEAPVGVFDHHLGHGIGLFPHEAPHLNPNWDDTFQESETFTAEPGLYAAELQAGMRIENNYVVTHDGVECLTDFPLEL